VLGSVDPVRDREIVDTELALADLDTVERRLDRVEKKAKSGEKEAIREKRVIERAHAALTTGRPLREIDLTEDESRVLKGFQLVTAKPVLYVANVAETDLPAGENAWTRALREAVTPAGGARRHAEVITICTAIESELSELAPEDCPGSGLACWGSSWGPPFLPFLVRAGRSWALAPAVFEGPAGRSRRGRSSRSRRRSGLAGRPAGLSSCRG